MTPFANTLHSIRMRYGIRQVELARLMGYEQTYISSLEVGKKGPPTSEFIDKLIDTLGLTEEEAEQLHDAADASQRKFIINDEVPQKVYWVLRDLRQKLPSLTNTQLSLIQFALDMQESSEDKPQDVIRKLKRRNSQEAHM